MAIKEKKKSFKDECKEIMEAQGNRGSIVSAIREYNKLVHTRSYVNERTQNTSVFAVEETVQPFVEDAVKSTFGMCWTSSEQPFRITHNDREIINDSNVITFYEEVASILIDELNNVQSGFTTALEQSLKNYFEYGCSFLQLIEDEESKSFYCKAFNLCNVYPSFSRTNKVDKLLVMLDMDKDKKLFFNKVDKSRWEISTLHKDDEIEKVITNFVPVYYLSQTPDNEMRFAIGQGLAALPEIKQMNAIVSDLSVASANLLKPIQYYFTQLCVSSNEAQSTIFNPNMSPIGINVLPNEGTFPFGWTKIPVEVAPAFEILNRLIVKLREKFGFINRLFSVKANEQMTATEATIRTRADRNQTKHLQDMITGQLLSPLFSSCLRILSSYKRLPKKPDLIKDMYDITFVHSSIYQDTEDEKRLAQINNGLALWGNIIQFSAIARQMGAPTPDLKSLTDEIGRILRFPAQQAGPAVVTANLIDTLLSGTVQEDEISEEDMGLLE